MAANEETLIPASARRLLESRGYVLDTQMAPWIASWWQWYTRAAGERSGDAGSAWDFYNIPYAVAAKDASGNQRRLKRRRRRLSLNPAARACQEWASLVLNEDTLVSAEDAAADAWLQEWLKENRFWPTGQQMVERAYATGTGAWALWADVREDATELRLRTYDARSIVPLSWDADGISECAFCSRMFVGGAPHHQLSIHRVGDAGRYVIETVLFDKDGRQADPGPLGILPEWDTGSETPTFGIVRPGVSNTCADASPYGQSVFHLAMGGAIQAVDMAFDSLMQEVKLTEAMVFMDEQMVDLRNESGTMVPVPTGTDGDRKFVTLAGQGREMGSLYEVYSPAIRTQPLREALDAALAELSEQCGFGQEYFTLDKAGGLRTATEVSSDNSALMRNIRKHENELRRAIAGVTCALLQSARVHCGAPVSGEPGAVSVQFDDSIVTDTQAEKAMMMNEVAAGIVPKWMYLEKFYGLPEDEARALAGEDAPGGDEGGF